jgi:hypothetical protein
MHQSRVVPLTGLSVSRQVVSALCGQYNYRRDG